MRVADAGATMVSGSQAHYPHIMEFRGESFIHYGLGNLFFDQMTYILPNGDVIDETRREFWTVMSFTMANILAWSC